MRLMESMHFHEMILVYTALMEFVLIFLMAKSTLSTSLRTHSLSKNYLFCFPLFWIFQYLLHLKNGHI